MGVKLILVPRWQSFPKITALFTSPRLSPGVVCYLFSALGVTAGAHRLWSHRSYKASFPLRVFLALGNSMAFQVSLGACVHTFTVYFPGQCLSLATWIYKAAEGCS